MKLVVVESPSKANTIKKYLGQSFKVAASLGHIKDLPQKALGVDIRNNFAPSYLPVPGKKKVIEQLRQAAQEADQVYIATDPDREGEAIAAHIAELIAEMHPSPHRVLFHEITRKAVQEAIKNPGRIDQRKVEAQIARRVVDRLVGYQVSPLIWKTVAKGLSAGRVQSVALRLICEREQEIRVFVAQEYWSIHAVFSGLDVVPFPAELIQIDGSKIEIGTEQVAQGIIERARGKDYKVSSFKKSTMRSKPAAPFTTSTLQQDAARKLKFSPRRTMVVAQALYEGVELPDGESVGLITYMRTDSTRIAAEAQAAAGEYIGKSFGKDYLPQAPRSYAQKKRTQDAHEAIRPTDVSRHPDDLKDVLDASQWKLYRL
ncbi:MAG TPA: type I DNA topoisomerase, partial [bacterium]